MFVLPPVHDAVERMCPRLASLARQGKQAFGRSKPAVVRDRKEANVVKLARRRTLWSSHRSRVVRHAEVRQYLVAQADECGVAAAARPLQPNLHHLSNPPRAR